MSFERVMIVDDAQIDRFLAKAMMMRCRFAKEVITVDSAMDALAFIESCQTDPGLLPDFIFLDINMPQMSGFDFLSEYESFPDEIKNICSIVMLSSSLNPKDINQALKSRYVDKFISKPINAAKLAALAENSSK